MKIGFYAETKEQDRFDFCCASQGFSDTESTFMIYPEEVDGLVFRGGYEGCIAFAKKNRDGAKAAILITESGGDENRIVKDLAGILGCPVTGGGSAMPTGRKEVQLMLLTGEGLSVHTDVRNVHQRIVEECRLDLADKRRVEKINGTDAAAYLRRMKEQLGYECDDFERVTLSTKDHINAHLSEKDGVILSGRDLEEHMLLRCVPKGKEQELIESFYQEKENAVIFGCAGLKRLLTGPFACKSTGAFLFGEICSFDGKSDFGNLMLSRLMIG